MKIGVQPNGSFQSPSVSLSWLNHSRILLQMAEIDDELSWLNELLSATHHQPCKIENTDSVIK